MTLPEEILSAWMKATCHISNKRLTDRMSYNEAAVCKALYEAEQEVTAKDLCQWLQMLKSQMNAVLGGMEGKGMIQKQRAQQDKRKYHIYLTAKGKQLFLAEHQKNLRLVEKVIARVGTERARCTAEVLNEVSQLFCECEG